MRESISGWEYWLEQLYNLRRDKSGLHERPHKPVLLLSIIDLLDNGVINRNEVPLSEPLIKKFKQYFAVVRRQNDRPTIQNPFFFLSGDKFWRLVPRPGDREIYHEGSGSGAPSVTELRRRVAFGTFDAGIWQLLNDPLSRHQLREAIIARYFPDDREKLAAIAAAGHSAEPAYMLRDELPPGRDGAFRKTILKIYECRCAACGMKVVLDQSISLVEAAHLIPFNISQNDKPTNGIALCPNHHWAMDRHLIAPVPDTKRRAGIWRVNETRLDDRIDGQRDLIVIAGKPVIPPVEEKFYPALESLQWRADHLLAVN